VRVELERSEGIAMLWLNRPESRNALDEGLLAELHSALRDLSDGDRVLIISGRGPIFCAGGDIRLTGTLGPLGERRRVEAFHAVIRALWELPQAVIAALNGPALGAGCGLSLVADLVLAVPSVYFCLPFAELALVPDSGLGWLLPRLIGMRRAMEAFLLGRRIEAEEAQRWGMINEVVPPERLLARARELAAGIARTPPEVVRLLRRNVHRSLEMTLFEVLELEASAQALCLAEEEHRTRADRILRRK